MRRSYFTVAFFLISVVGSFAQCIPAVNFSGTGLTYVPDELATVFTCAGCGDQTRVISIQTFADTTLSVELAPGNPALDVQVFADRFRLDSIAGLPEGITYTTDAAFDTTFDAIENPFGYWINPGDTTVGFENTSGCISLEGTEAGWNAAVNGGPNSDGVYPLTLFIDARAANFAPGAIGGIVGFNTWLTEMGALLEAFGDPNFTVNGIRLAGPNLVISASGVGIHESGQVIRSMNVFPNPVTDAAVVEFRAFKPASGQLQVVDLTGRCVIARSISLAPDFNRIEMDMSGLRPGVYSASVIADEQIQTVRFVMN